MNGLYGDDTRIFCDTIGEQGAPYVFLLTQEDRVEYIDVLACLRAGYFCASGSLLGVDNIKTFTSASDANGFRSVYAMTGSGESIELDQLIEADQHSVCDSFTGDWSCSRTISLDGGGSYEEFVSLTMNGCDNMSLTCYRPDQDTEMESIGYLIYLGMMENGAVYAHRSWGLYSNGPGLEGAIALEGEYDYGGSFPTCTLNITELSGTPFIGERTGETAALVQSFG